MSTSPSTLQLADLDLPTLVSLVGAAVDRRVLDGLTAAQLRGLRSGHGHVVQRLVDGPSTAGEIAAALGVTQQAVSKTVKELIELGYVKQSRDPADGRRHPLALTTSGRAAVRSARRSRASLHDQVAGSASAADLAAARRVLEQLAHVLGLDEDVARRAVPPPPSQT